ncbi:probable serine/threonine-protein kinase WNK10 [Spinacia oleracea]|uniref:non-specific serine/threonine protein kinase n=1 Tax=Spinacia oleracea TaxID=3562 RepID=A0A9R0JPB1_SPIOL|nr:probable serine/threonine-protein kinase WNK10 [Spinacia oleracea]
MSSSSVIQVPERDPTGQYVRYDEILGEGNWKKVYKGFDEVNGIEIAWNVVALKDRILNSASNLSYLIAEAELMKLLDHKNIVKCYHFWVDYENSKLYLITELFSSETLLHYIKHVPVNHTSIKNWCRQILNGLNYLHTRNPPICHLDVKLLNIFVDGNSGTIKLGDFGFAKLIEPRSSGYTCYGTLLYMAPEMFEGNYNEMVDIHAFGICVLQMITREILYQECRNMNEMYKKIEVGIKPYALINVSEPQIKTFLNRCLAPVSMRPPAIELLNDPFLAVAPTPSLSSVTSTDTTSLSETESNMSEAESSLSQVTSAQVDGLLKLVKEIKCGDKIFKLKGSMKRDVIVPMRLSIVYNVGGKYQVEDTMKFKFPMAMETGNIDEFVREKIGTPMNLCSEDVAVVIEIIKQLRTELLALHYQPNITSVEQKLMSEELDYNLGNLFAENPAHEILTESRGDGDESEAENNGMLSCLGKLLSSVCSNS